VTGAGIAVVVVVDEVVGFVLGSAFGGFLDRAVWLLR